MSINKAQGQSLARVGLLLHDSVFAYGQLYVALSRVSSFQNIRVIVVETSLQGWRDGSEDVEPGVYTDNIVYKDILLDQSKDIAFAASTPRHSAQGGSKAPVDVQDDLDEAEFLSPLASSKDKIGSEENIEGQRLPTDLQQDK